MAVSSQPARFKPSSCPPPQWFSSSYISSSSVASPLSFWRSSRKALHRKGDCAVHRVSGPLSNMVVFSSSLQFKRGSGYNAMPLCEKYTQIDMKFCHQPIEWKLVVPTQSKNSSSIARMLPDLPDHASSKGNSFSGGFGSVQRLEEEKKQGCQRGSASGAAGTPWLEERKRLRDMRMSSCRNRNSSYRDTGILFEGHTGTIMQSGLEGLQDDSTCERLKCYSNATGDRPLQSSFRQENVGNEQIELQVHRTTHKSSGECSAESEGSRSLVSGLTNDGIAACTSTYGTVSISGNDNELTKLSSWQYSSDNPESNAGNGALTSTMGQGHLVDSLVSQVYVPSEKSISLQPKYFRKDKRQSGTTDSHVQHMPASSQHKYRRSKNTSDHNIGGPIHYLRERASSSAQTFLKGMQPNGLSSRQLLGEWEERNLEKLHGGTVDELRKDAIDSNTVKGGSIKPRTVHDANPRKRLLDIYDKVIVVDNITNAEEIVRKLTNQYKHCVHACDTEVANIDVKLETPVDHGEIICFSIYSGPEANFGDGKSCVWVDILDGGGKDLLAVFAPFFEDKSIKKVWHNYSFDKHVIENYGLEVHGFHADTMHMARLWDSSRRTEGGYSLEALTGDPNVCPDENLIGKMSMKTIFGRKKVKKNGSEGKIITIPPVEELQREQREEWICYSALDSMSTFKLYGSLKSKLLSKQWKLDGNTKGTMLDFYEDYWRPFGELLVEMETSGMLVDRSYLAEIEKVARAEQQFAANRFCRWASKYCADAKYMNVGSDAQLRQLFFGGTQNSKDHNGNLPLEREFKVPNVDKVIEEGKKTPTKFRNIKLHKIGERIGTELFTASGWPSVSGDALKSLAGKVSTESDFADEDSQLQSEENTENLTKTGVSKVAKVGTVKKSTESTYGTAYAAFGEGQEGKEACHAIAALCEVCSIDSLISNFILPLQESHISGKNGRIHCSLNINTETGRLSARRPNLQNQPALEKDRYKIRQAFIASPRNSLIVADYGQLELRILAHLANCKSMLDAFKAGGDFHSRTAMNMYPHIREAVEQKRVLLEWHPEPGQEKPPVPLLKDAFASERRKAKMLNFSIAYGKTPVGLARDWKVSVKEAKETVERWYNGRQEVRAWQEKQKEEAEQESCVHTLLGRARSFPSMANATNSQRGHIERAAINAPVQGSAADVAMCAMLAISRNAHLGELGWRLLLQVHDEVILEGPTESAEVAKAIVVDCMSKPFDGKNILKVDLSVDAKCAQNWYLAK